VKLVDLLEYTAEEYLDDRTALLDGEPDVLWSDKTLVRYFNEAQRRLCRRAWSLIDLGHPQAGVIVLATGKTIYNLHKSVLRVYSARLESDTLPLSRSTDDRLAGYRTVDPDFFDVNQPAAFTPGAPLVFTTDTGTRLLHIEPAPAAAQNGSRVLLKVARLPVCELTTDKPDESPEVAEEYHLDGLCKYAAGKALTHPNADASAKTEGRVLLKEFEDLVKEARQDRQRAEAAEPRFQFASTTASIR